MRKSIRMGKTKKNECINGVNHSRAVSLGTVFEFLNRMTKTPLFHFWS